MSGARLRARFVEAHGSRVHVGFFDTARNEDCTFARVGGVLRCIPSAVSVSFLGGQFEDAGCTVPVAQLPECAAGARYVAVEEPSVGECARRDPAFRPVLGRATAPFQGTPGSCTPSPIAAGASVVLALGDVVPWTAFVSAEEALVTKDGLTEKIAVATDGARQTVGWQVEAWQADCHFRSLEDGTLRCVPDEAETHPLGYTDASCTRAEYVTLPRGRCAKTDPRFVLEGARTRCARAVHAVEEWTPDTPAQLYADSGGSSCFLTSTPDAQSRRRIEDVTASLPALPRSAEGTSRLVPALVADGSGDALVPGFHDRDKGVDCSFARAADGTLRCLPAAPEAVIFATDGTCTGGGLVAGRLGSASCGATAGRFVRSRSAAACGVRWVAPPVVSAEAVTTRVFELEGAPRAVSDVGWVAPTGTCSRVTSVAAAVDATETNPAEFVKGTFTTE